ncbi:MAG: hypothetical protein AAF572_28070 [Cyanobacteria bacterium P01_B01_bin.77]
MRLTKIPSIFRRLTLDYEIEVSSTIDCREGSVIAVQSLSEQNVRNHLEFFGGRLGTLVTGDIIPGVLGKRRASRELSGDIPTTLQVGDTVYMLGSTGVFGEITSYDPAYGKATPLKVLGSIVREGIPLNLRDAAIPWRDTLPTSVPLIAVLATAMDTGKTTVSRKIVTHFKTQGLKVAYTKLTGLAYQGELFKVKDFGADPVLECADGGLPSTCGDPTQVAQMALGLLFETNRSQPDLIIAEFGAGILGEYNVMHLLKEPDLRAHIKATVVAANDAVSAWGAKELLDRLGLPITLITGPVANNQTESKFVTELLGIPAERNLNQEMPKLMESLTTALGMSM